MMRILYLAVERHCRFLRAVSSSICRASMIYWTESPSAWADDSLKRRSISMPIDETTSSWPLGLPSTYMLTRA